jgi:hypothetical protein
MIYAPGDIARPDIFKVCASEMSCSHIPDKVFHYARPDTLQAHHMLGEVM